MASLSPCHNFIPFFLSRGFLPSKYPHNKYYVQAVIMGAHNNKKGEQDYEEETTGWSLCTGITAFHDSGS
jgi:hypothetical protein